MKPRHTASLFAVLALSVMAGGDRVQDTDTPSSSAASGNAKSPAFAAGQILTLDESGKISPRALRTIDLAAGLGEALSTSSEGLVEVRNTGAGGGYTVDLQGRFQNAMTIVVDENGKTIEAPCVSGSPDDAKPEVK